MEAQDLPESGAAFDGPGIPFLLRKALETARMNEQRFRLLFELSPDPTSLSRWEDGTLLMVNQAWCEITGIPAAEAIGRAPSALGSWARPEEREALLEELRRTGQSAPRESTLCRRDGGRRRMLISAKLMNLGSEPEILIVGKDMTECRELMAALGESSLALERSEAQFRMLFERAPLGMTIVDSASGRFLSANARMGEIVGYTPEELLASTFQDITHPGNVDEDLDSVRSLAAGAVAEVRKEKRYIHRSGKTVWGRLMMVRLPTAPGAPQRHLALVEDITEQRFQEEERAETARLTSMIHSGTDFHACMAGLTASLQGWSGCEAVGIRLCAGDDFPYLETRGFPAAFVAAESSLCGQGCDAAGRPELDCMCGNVVRGRFDPGLPFFTPDGSFWTNSTTGLLAGTTEQDRQSRTRNRCNGEGYESVALVPLQAGAQVFGLLQFNDHRPGRFSLARIQQFERMAETLATALAQRQAESALRESEERFRLAMDATSDGLWDWDLTTGRVYFSPSCTGMLGFGPGEFPDRMEAWTGRILDEDRAHVIASKQACIAGTAQAFELEYRIRTKDGGTRWILGRGRAVSRDPQGRALRLIGTHSDITGRKLAEAEIRALNEDLEQRVLARTAQLETANREMEAFSYSVSHDLRAPLRGIDGYSQVLLEDCSDQLDEAGRRYLGRIRQGTRRMGQIIEDLLKLSRISRSGMDLAEVDLTRLCLEVADRLARAEPQRRVAFSVQPGMRLRADPRLLEVALENLLGNAWKFTSKVPEARIAVAQADAPDGRAVCIRDNGAGFDMAYAGKLFTAFERLHPVAEFDGTGIGLAIVQRIVQRHGGRVWAEGEPGRGAAFFFALPLAEPEPDD